MNVEELLTAVNDGGRKWTLFRHSKPSKKKMIASLIAWSQSLSQQLGESNDRERELQHENGDLKSQQAQFEERLDAMTKQVTHHKAKETQLERKLDKIENNAKAIEDEITALRTKKHELEMTKQHLESDTARLKGEIKGKEDIINHTKDALEKCRHDCTNKETKYLTVESEKSRLEDKLQASAEEKRYLQSEIDRLHEHIFSK